MSTDDPATEHRTRDRHQLLTLVLDRALLGGLCADLGTSPADEAEVNRRAQEVALILRSAGVPVLIEL